MTNDKGAEVREAGPSVPVEITGLTDVPAPGDEFSAVADERMARQLRTAIEPYSRSKTQVTADHLEHRKFEDWSADQRDFTSLSLYRMRPLKGGMIIAIEAEFITQLLPAVEYRLF